MAISKTTAIIGTLGASGGVAGTAIGAHYLYSNSKDKESTESLNNETPNGGDITLETVEEAITIVPERAEDDQENPVIPKVREDVSSGTTDSESLPAEDTTTDQQLEDQAEVPGSTDSDTKTNILKWSKEEGRKCEVRIKYDGKEIAVKDSNDVAILKEVWIALNGQNKDKFSNDCKPNLENRRDNENMTHYLDLEKESNGTWDVGEIDGVTP